VYVCVCVCVCVCVSACACVCDYVCVMSTHVNECRHAYEHMSLVGLNAFCKCSFNDVTTHMHTHTLCTVQVMQEFVTQAHAHTHIDTLCTVQVMQEFDDALPTRRFDNFQFVNFTSE